VHGWIGLLVYAHPLGLFDLSVCWCGRTNTSDLCMGECVFVIACVCAYMYTRTPTQSDLYYLNYLYLQPLACLGRSINNVSCHIHVSISTCVFRDDVCLDLFWRRMAICPCTGRQPRKVGCKWWPCCWRPTQIVSALQIRYEDGNLASASCVLCAT